MATLPTGVSQAETDAICLDLVTKGEQAKQDYIQNHCPTYLLANLADYLGNIAPAIKNGDSVVVHNAANANQAGSPATATVTGGVLQYVKLTV